MASEYLMKKYKDVKPEEPKVLTPQEKRANWLHYHRIHFIIGAVLLLVGVGVVKDVFMKTEPDYQIGYFSDLYLSDTLEAEIEERLSALGEDLNGDGKVVVQLNPYVIVPEDPLSYTVQISMVGDMSVGLSDYYLVADPVFFQEEYGILTMTDGSIFDVGMDPNLCVRYPVKDCAVFDGLEFEEDLYLTRRQFVKEEDLKAHAGAAGLWDTMTAGAAMVSTEKE